MEDILKFSGDNNLLSPNSYNTGKNLNEFLFLIFRKWYWLFLSGIIAFGAAWYYLQTQDEVYEVQGSMFIRKPDSNIESQALLKLGVLQGANSYFNLETEMQILGSRKLMRQVVDSLNINNTYFLSGFFRDEELFGKDSPVRLVNVYENQESYDKEFLIEVEDSLNFLLIDIDEDDSLNLFFNIPFSYGGGAYIIESLDRLEPGQKIKIQVKDPEIVAQEIASEIEIEPLSLGSLPSDVLRMTVESATTEKAKAILNTMVEIYIRNELVRKKLSEQKALSFIDERLNYVTQELYTVEQQVEGYRRRRQLPTEISQSAESVLGQLEKQDDELAKMELQNSLLSRIEEIFRDESTVYQPLPIVSGTLEGVLTQLVPQYNQLIIEREVLLKTATQDNPAVRVVNDKLNQLNNAIQINIRNTKQQLKEQQRQIELRLEPIQERIEALPTYERELVQIIRQQQIKEQLFLFLLQRREESAISLSRQISDAEMLDKAMVFDLLRPKKVFIYAISTLIGLLIPIGFLYFSYIVDNKIYLEKDINALTKAPVISSINQNLTDETIVVDENRRSAIAESFRLFRTNLQFMNKNRNKTATHLITSTMPGEGKSFISLNLGMVYALSGKKTVILEFDLRKPKLFNYLFEKDIKPSIGLSNYLIGNLSEEEIILHSNLNENLYIIPCGPIPPNPSELITGELTEKLFEYLKGNFEYIIIDSAPVGLVADALLLGKFADSSLYIVRSGYTNRSDLDFLNKNIENRTLPSVGIVLNGVKLGGRGYYGKGYGYGRYQGYYTDDESKKKGLKKIFSRKQ